MTLYASHPISIPSQLFHVMSRIYLIIYFTVHHIFLKKSIKRILIKNENSLFHVVIGQTLQKWSHISGNHTIESTVLLKLLSVNNTFNLAKLCLPIFTFRAAM